MYKNTTGKRNTAVGSGTLYNNTEGEKNTAIGEEAGASNTTGSGNVFIGNQAGNNSNYSTVSNKLIIANNNDSSLIRYSALDISPAVMDLSSMYFWSSLYNP